ncbi:MAG: PAAR domain-containing protein [Acetobacter aceti]|uniref:Uncharacterized protein n=1 Tax=Acetobacter aceti TaxID=435 RepID=A0A1U9KCU6_ACEAC|nr:PAAR domain-containing protein [Acetobacter aceti]AQS83641.1 hypothetical protein A0U92_01385 [Acetobacter aceti]
MTADELAVNAVAGGYFGSKAEEIGERAGSGMMSATGTIVEGSANVSINGKRAAFVTRKVVCSKTGHQPGDMIAEPVKRDRIYMPVFAQMYTAYGELQ